MALLKSIKEIGKDMSVYGISSILSQLISLLLLPLYTQKLTPEDYGAFALIGICVNGYSTVSDFGISSALFRFTGIGKDENEKLGYFISAKIINLISNTITLFIFLIFINLITQLIFNDSGFINFAYYILISGVISSFSNILFSFLRVNRETSKFAKSSFINLVASVIFTFIGLVYLDMGVWGALLGGGVGNLFSLFYLIHVTPRVKLEINQIKIKKLLNFAMPMFPHKIISFFLPITAQIILMKHMDLAALGIYNIALKFALPLVLFVNIFQKAYAPYRFEIYKEGNTNSDLFAKINLLYFMLTFTGYATISLFGDWILTEFTDEKFHSAGTYIPFLALIPLTQSIYFAFGTGVEFSKRPKFYPLISLIGFLSIVSMSIITIPKYHIIGATLSTAVGWLIMAFCMFIYAQRIFPIKYLWKKIIVVSIVTLSVVSSKYVIQDKWFTILLFIFHLGVCTFLLKPYLLSLKTVLFKK